LQNQEKEKREKKEKRKREKAKGKGQNEKDGKDAKGGKGIGMVPEGAEDEEWVGNHPWRPFDRERDLGGSASLKPKSAEDILKKSGTLSSRFGASGGRAFL
jgi:hypothetical protein